MAGIHTAASIGGAMYGMKGPSTVTVYHVEGAPNTRLLIGDNGQVTVTGSTTLYLNFGDKARALDFLKSAAFRIWIMQRSKLLKCQTLFWMI